jgi:flagellar M-ring protein FliF
MELLTEAPVNSQRKALQLNGGALTPELLNDLIRQKPANVGVALKDWMNIKKVS